MNLKEYNELASKLSYAPPLAKCCDKWMGVIHVEPLEGRSTLVVERSCIVKCEVCGGMFRSRYD